MLQVAEVQRCIPELEPHFITWDCKSPEQSCDSDKPDMAWRHGETLLHIKIDEMGDDREMITTRITGRELLKYTRPPIANQLLLRFNPDKSANGRAPCVDKRTMPSGTIVYERDEKEWLSRMPVLISEVKIKSGYKSWVEEGGHDKTE